jgi:hypothetical protein
LEAFFKQHFSNVSQVQVACNLSSAVLHCNPSTAKQLVERREEKIKGHKMELKAGPNDKEVKMFIHFAHKLLGDILSAHFAGCCSMHQSKNIDWRRQMPIRMLFKPKSMVQKGAAQGKVQLLGQEVWMEPFDIAAPLPQTTPCEGPWARWEG